GQLSAVAFGAIQAVSTHSKRYILFAINFVGTWCGKRTGFKLCFPQNFAGIFIKCAKHVIPCRSDKYQSACGSNGSAEILRTCRGNAPGGQLLKFPKRNLPYYLSFIQIDRIQCSP